MSAHDRVKLNMARTTEEARAKAKLPEADSKTQAVADAARARQTNNHPGRG